MKEKILFFMFFVISSVALFGGEMINGKKVFSNEEIMENMNGGSTIWNKFRDENPDIDFGTFFENKELKKVNMAAFNLKGISFKDSNMAGADLKGADMEGCNLEHVNFYNADLKNSNLRNVNLLKANLENTALYNSNMENARVDLKWRDKIEKKNVNKFKFIDWKK